MFSVTLLTVGKLKEKFYLEAVKEDEKRLRGYGQFSLLELPEQRLPENPAPGDISRALQKEAEAVREKIPKGAWLCVFTPEGKSLSSEELSETLKQVKLSGKSAACFVIGSSFGMDESLKKQADFRLSFSKMTFPHHLFRVMALEQLYRAECISVGSPYHK